MPRGIMGVMEIYVVAKKHTANAMMRNLIYCINVWPNDMIKCVATAVKKNSESFRMSGDTDWSLSFIGPVRF